MTTAEPISISLLNVDSVSIKSNSIKFRSIEKLGNYPNIVEIVLRQK